MRLLIVGTLKGQLTTATKIAMDNGASVTHAEDHEQAMRVLRGGKGADLLLVDVALDIRDLVMRLEAEHIHVPIVACGISNDARAAVAGNPSDAGGRSRARAGGPLMQNRLLYILLALVAVILIVRASVFTVSEGQLAIKSIGGEIVESNYKPGLHFKIPLVNEVSRYDARILTQMYPSEHFLTREQEQLNVDFYVKWRILNLRRYYESTGGTEDVANARLGETVKDSIKSVVTQRTLQQGITAERAEFTEAMMKTARP